MARIVKPLSDKQIKEAKPKAKDYKLTDGDGLGLIVSKSGRKRWVFGSMRLLPSAWRCCCHSA